MVSKVPHIRSSGNTFGIGIITEKGKVLSDVRDMYKPKKGWGIIPKECAEHHERVKERVLGKALAEAGIGMERIDLIAFSNAPGLAPSLWVGFNFAKGLSEKYKKPLVGVNHLVAHIEIGKAKTGMGDPITILATGANNQIAAFVEGRFRVFGESMDVGLGNALDKFGRETGLGFPAGPKIEELARKGKYLELPYVVKGMDLSFSGILTAALNMVKKGEYIEDVCFSLQETYFSMLTEVAERAMAHTGKKELMLTGGVAQNKRLCEMLGIMCKERGARFSVCPPEYCGDNAVMIAWLGMLKKSGGSGNVYPRERIEEVEVNWV